MSHPPSTPPADLLRVEPTTQMTEAEAVALRERYLRHERRLQLIGWALYVGWPALVVGGVFFFVGCLRALMFVAGGFSKTQTLSRTGLSLLGGAAFILMGAASCAAASGLRNLDAGQRRLTKAVVLLWMLTGLIASGSVVYDREVPDWVWRCGLALPLSLWAYYMVSCRASDVVFSPEYKEARLLTPPMNRESSTAGTVLFVLVVVAPLALLCSSC